MRRPRLDSRLEKQLRAHRAEASDGLVARVASTLGRGRYTFGPRVRWGLAGAFVVAMIGASVSAGIPGPPAPPTSPDATTTSSISSSSSVSNNDGKGNGEGSGNSDGEHPPPSHDQYKGHCGGPPREICKVEVDPKNPKVDEGGSVTLNATVLPDHTDCTFTVQYQTANGTGKDGAASEDYVAQSGTLFFGPGVDTASVTIATTADSGTKDESFFVNFSILPSSASCAQLAANSSQVEITITNQKDHGK